MASVFAGVTERNQTMFVSTLARLVPALAASLLLPLSLPAPARAQENAPPPLVPGISAHDPRVHIDPNREPWRAIGKLQAAVGGVQLSCTGTLIGPATVLTAAHCLFNPRTRAYVPATSLHFLTGFAGDTFAGHAAGRRFILGPGYDPAAPDKTRGADWALVTLDQPLGKNRALALLDHAPAIGAEVMIGGYNRDFRFALTADTACRIVGLTQDSGGRPLLHHNCTGTQGVSGAPILLRENGRWLVAGVDVAAELGLASGYALPPTAIRPYL
jgi:protease YdgD